MNNPWLFFFLSLTTLADGGGDGGKGVKTENKWKKKIYKLYKFVWFFSFYTFFTWIDMQFPQNVHLNPFFKHILGPRLDKTSFWIHHFTTCTYVWHHKGSVQYVVPVLVSLYREYGVLKNLHRFITYTQYYLPLLSILYHIKDIVRYFHSLLKNIKKNLSYQAMCFNTKLNRKWNANCLSSVCRKTIIQRCILSLALY